MARKSRNREDRRERANERKEVADGRTPQEQLARLDDILGKGKGAVKERAKLAKKIKDLKNKPKEKKDEDNNNEIG